MSIETEYYLTQVGHLEEAAERLTLCMSDYADTLDEIKGRWRDDAYKKIERVSILPLSDEYELFNSGVIEHYEQCRSTSELLNLINDSLNDITELFDHQEELAQKVATQSSKYAASRKEAEHTLDECGLKNKSINAKIKESLALL